MGFADVGAVGAAAGATAEAVCFVDVTLPSCRLPPLSRPATTDCFLRAPELPATTDIFLRPLYRHKNMNIFSKR